MSGLVLQTGLGAYISVINHNRIRYG